MTGFDQRDRLAHLGVILHPEKFGLDQKIEWTAFALILGVVGPIVASRSLVAFYPKERGLQARIRRARKEGLLGQRRENVGVLWFGIGCIIMALFIAAIILIPAWTAK